MNENKRNNRIVRRLRKDLKRYIKRKRINNITIRDLAKQSPQLNWIIGKTMSDRFISNNMPDDIKSTFRKSSVYKDYLSRLQRLIDSKVERSLELEPNTFSTNINPSLLERLQIRVNRIRIKFDKESPLDDTKKREVDLSLKKIDKVSLRKSFSELNIDNQSLNDVIKDSFDNSQLLMLNKLDDDVFKRLFAKQENIDILKQMSIGKFTLTLSLLSGQNSTTDENLRDIILENLNKWSALSFNDMQFFSKSQLDKNCLKLFIELGNEKYQETIKAIESGSHILKVLVKRPEWEKMSSQQMNITIKAVNINSNILKRILLKNFDDWIKMTPQQLEKTVEAFQSKDKELIDLVAKNFKKWKEKHSIAMSHITDIVLDKKSVPYAEARSDNFRILLDMNAFQLRILKESFAKNDNPSLQYYVLGHLERQKLVDFTKENLKSFAYDSYIPQRVMNICEERPYIKKYSSNSELPYDEQAFYDSISQDNPPSSSFDLSMPFPPETSFSSDDEECKRPVSGKEEGFDFPDRKAIPKSKYSQLAESSDNSFSSFRTLKINNKRNSSKRKKMTVPRR